MEDVKVHPYCPLKNLHHKILFPILATETLLFLGLMSTRALIRRLVHIFARGRRTEAPPKTEGRHPGPDSCPCPKRPLFPNSNRFPARFRSVATLRGSHFSTGKAQNSTPRYLPTPIAVRKRISSRPKG